MKNRLSHLLLFAIAALLLYRFLDWPSTDNRLGHTPAQNENKLPGGPFTLLDHRRNIVSTADFQGKFLLIFFGYTNCPDICPTGLNDMAVTLEKLGARAVHLQPLFITIDPDRDDPATMAEYVGRFHPRIVGLTGSPKQVRNAATAYQIHYAKSFSDNAEANTPMDYTMDHSSFYFLMGPKGEFLDMFGHGQPPDKMASKIKSQIEKKIINRQ